MSAPEKVRRGGWLIGLLAAGALSIFFVDEVQQELAEGPRLWITADQSRGLAVGAPVWLSGHRVGRVTDVRFRPPGAAGDGRVLVRTVIRGDDAPLIRADASAALQPSAPMAPTVVALAPGSPEAPPYDFGDTLAASRVVTSTEVRARAERARAALDTLRRAEERALALADTGRGTVARFRRDEGLQRRLRSLREQLARAAALARRDSSGLARLSRNPEVLEGLRGSLDEAGGLADRLTAEAERWSGLSARLADLRATARRLDTLMRGAHGSAGRFVHDRALERELGELRRGIRATQAELLADPFRWLRFRLF